MSRQIIFDGMRDNANVTYLCLRNDIGEKVEIPLDKNIAKLLGTYFDKLAPRTPELVERGNDEANDQE